MPDTVTPPEIEDVELQGGVKVKMPAAEAAKYRDARAKDKNEREALATRIGAIEAEKRAAEEAKLEAERQKAAAEAAKAGDLKKTEEILTAKHRDRESKLGNSLKTKAIEAAVASIAKLAPTAKDDVVELLSGRTRYDLDAETVLVLDAAGQPLKDDAGKPLGVDAYLASLLPKKPHWLLSALPSGSGAGPGDKPGASAGTITLAEYEAAQKGADHGQAIAQRIAQGKLRVVD